MAKVVKSSNRGAMPGERRGGRQKGTRNKKTKELLTRVGAEGVMPLDVMLHNMRKTHAAVTEIEKKMAESKSDATDQVVLLALREASETCAKDAAPYLHARLSSVETTTKPYDLSKLTDRELAELDRLIRRAEADQRGHPDGDGPPAGAPAPRRGPTLN